jgi:hypothetical protein
MANNLNDKLDSGQVIKSVYDIDDNSLRVSVVSGSGGGGALAVEIDASEDSIAIGDGTDLATITTVGPKKGLDVNVINNPINVVVSNEVEVTNDAGNPLPVNGTVTANLGTLNGAATSALQITGNTSLASIDSKLTSPITVTGPLTDAQLRASEVPVSLTSTTISNFPSNQDVTVTSSVLPIGASTSALQTAGNASLTSIDSKLTSPLTVQATNLDIRDLVFTTDKVDISGSSVAVSNFPAVQSIDDNGGSLTVDGTVELGATSLAALENITIDDITDDTTRELGRVLGSDILYVSEIFNTTSSVLAQARPVNGDLNVRHYKAKTIFVQNTSVNAGRYSIFASVDDGVNYDIPVVNSVAIAAGVTAVTNTENAYTHLRITVRSQTGGQTTTYVTKAYAQGV